MTATREGTLTGVYVVAIDRRACDISEEAHQDWRSHRCRHCRSDKRCSCLEVCPYHLFFVEVYMFSPKLSRWLTACNVIATICAKRLCNLGWRMVAPRLSLVSSKVSQTALKQTLRSMVEDRTALDFSLSERTYVEPFLSLSLWFLLFIPLRISS